ncbi:MAG: 3-deoxy-D-manno-octulosonic acid transferase [Rhodospirillaceae bacterium]
MLGLYRFLTTAGAPLIQVYLGRRLRKGKEDPYRFGERLGRPSAPRPDGGMIWLHAASVGEALSLLTLIDRLSAECSDAAILVTTGTVTSARLMADRLPGGVIHQYVPVDRLSYVRRFLDHWSPNLILWAESEFWPNMVSEIGVRGTPMVLINGRVSPGSLKGWSWAPGFIGRLLAAFDLCLGQTQGDADRLVQLGATRAKTVGNLKFAADPLPADREKLDWLRQATAGRPVWLAASTWPGEEDIALRVHNWLKAAHPGLLTIIVPRHPTRGGDIQSGLAAAGARVSRRATSDRIVPETEIYLADTMGELGLFFTLAPVVFMGKSLTAEGGQNILEPARLGVAVLHGPRMTNFGELAQRMAGAGASRVVSDGNDLADAVGQLLGDPAKTDAMAVRARAFADGEAGVIDRVMNELSPYLLRLGDRVRAS